MSLLRLPGKISDRHADNRADEKTLKYHVAKKKRSKRPIIDKRALSVHHDFTANFSIMDSRGQSALP
jgi:hypothetical protein